MGVNRQLSGKSRHKSKTMFVDKARNRELAIRLWEGKPSERLLWAVDLNWSNFSQVAREAHYEDPIAYAQDTLGSIQAH